MGMGADLFDRRPDLLGETANEAVGFDLRSMCLDGPEEELTRTEHAQPAIFAVSYALYDELRSSGLPEPSAMAGHSLGEYTALAAAGAFSFPDGLRLVASRGRAMAAAASLEPSGMAALIGADLDAARSICERRVAGGGRLEVANVNAPGQVVVAGGEPDIEWLAANAADLGARRAIQLKVAGAFHSSYMAPARDELAAALGIVDFEEPDPAVFANTTAAQHTRDMIAETLERQIVEPVLFSSSLESMRDAGVDVFLHCGPGDVTAGLARKTLAGVATVVVSGLDDIRAALDALGTMD